MKFLASLLAIASLAVGINAASCTCGSNSYSNTDITAAITKGTSVNANPTSRSGAYPHQFGNGEKLKFSGCSSGTFVEYPLKKSPAWASGAPGADRVVYKLGTTTFCGCMTHTGASGNSFVLCK